MLIFCQNEPNVQHLLSYENSIFDSFHDIALKSVKFDPIRNIKINYHRLLPLVLSIYNSQVYI